MGRFPSILVKLKLQHMVGDHNHFHRQSLWDFLKAAFPSANYCLCSATMTDEAIKDVQCMY